MARTGEDLSSNQGDTAIEGLVGNIVSTGDLGLPKRGVLPASMFSLAASVIARSALGTM
jgi:hypothetical protein